MTIRVFRRISAALLALAPALAQAAPQTQPRTFVSAKNGSDAANCGRTSPCRTFTRAIAMTNAGGEVVVLDSGGFGSVTINQAVTLEAPDGVYAGITASSGDAITVVAGVNDVVVLRGLTLVGAGTSGNGITVSSADTIHVEHCTIRGFATGNGIVATQATFQFLYVEDSEVSECNIGVNVLPTLGQIQEISSLALSRSRFQGSQSEAILIVGGDKSSSLVYAVVSECSIRGFGGGIIGGPFVELVVDRCVIDSTGFGGSLPDVAVSGNSLLYLTNSVIPNSFDGVLVSSESHSCSLGNNFIANVRGTLDQCPLR